MFSWNSYFLVIFVWKLKCLFFYFPKLYIYNIIILYKKLYTMVFGPTTMISLLSISPYIFSLQLSYPIYVSPTSCLLVTSLGSLVTPFINVPSSHACTRLILSWWRPNDGQNFGNKRIEFWTFFFFFIHPVWP